MVRELIYSNEELKRHHVKTLWARLATLMLGIWLILAPCTFGYHDDHMSAWNDHYTGLALVLISLIALNFKLRSVTWAIALIGVWLGFAPLAFWAKSPVVYLNDTVVGALAICLSVIVPFRPEAKDNSPQFPIGWSYNPSSWHQRIPVIFFGFVGWFIARYLAAYQLGYIDTVWDPFFGDGTLKVITSDISKAFPVSDAGLGALAYSLEALLGCKGGTRRWYTMPWTVILFGILVVPLGFTSILLVILQPSIVGAWCGLCLIIAFCMLIMLALTVDEVVATVTFLVKAHREGGNFWKVFWYGGTVEGALDTRTPTFGTGSVFSPMIWGVTLPWNLCLTTLVGVWTLFVPKLFSVTGSAADGCYIAGALIIVFSLLSLAEVIRALRYLNVLSGIWLIALPWLLTGAPECALTDSPMLSHCESFIWSGIISGALLILLTLPRGAIKERYGDWQKYIV